MLRILNSYPWTRLSLKIIGAIKRQFFHTVTLVFDNSNLSQEIFAINTWGAVICFLGHGHRHMLTILLNNWRPGLSHIFSQTALFWFKQQAVKISVGQLWLWEFSTIVFAITVFPLLNATVFIRFRDFYVRSLFQKSKQKKMKSCVNSNSNATFHSAIFR